MFSIVYNDFSYTIDRRSGKEDVNMSKNMAAMGDYIQI